MLFVRLFGLCLFRLSVSFSFWGLGRAAVCDCGTPWTFLLPFLYMHDMHTKVLIRTKARVYFVSFKRFEKSVWLPGDY